MYRFIVIRKRAAVTCAVVLALLLAGGICFAAAGVVTTQEQVQQTESVRLPVLMYHSVLKILRRQGHMSFHPKRWKVISNI